MSVHSVIIGRGGAGAVCTGGHGAIVSLNYAANATGRRFAPVIPFQEHPDGVLNNRVASWGPDNLYPQNRIELIEKDTELPQLLDFKSRMLRGIGIMPFKIDGYEKTGHPKYTVAEKEDKDAILFCQNRKTKQWLNESSVDFNYFYNTFPQLILSRDRSKITTIAHQETAFCRLAEQDTDGRIKQAFLNARWDMYNEQHTITLPVIDTRAADDLHQLRSDSKFSYIFRCKYPVPGNPYYSTPLHEGFFTGGWYDVSQAIPEAKKYIMQNMMLVRYHLEIADWWWEKRYPDFWDKDEAFRLEKQQDELAKFNDFLVGVKKAGKTITTDMLWDEDNGKYREAWKITPMEDKEKEGKWIDDSREASMHKLRAMGLDPAIVGAGPGRDNASSGSGSDKWAAIKLYLATLPQHREVLLQPIQFIFDYNGWTDRGLVPMIVDHSYFYTNTASEKQKTEKNENPNPERNAA